MLLTKLIFALLSPFLGVSAEVSEPKFFTIQQLNPLANYQFITDLNQEGEEFQGTHSLSLDFSYSFRKRFFLSTGLSMAFESSDSSIVRTSEEEEFFKFSDLYFGGGYQFAKTGPWVLSMFSSFSLPTSDLSRFEGYRGVGSFSGNAFHRIPSVKWFSMGANTRVNYIFNRFDFSPGVPSGAQPEISLRGGLSLFFRLPYGLRYNVSGWVQSTEFTTGTDVSRVGNTHTLAYTYQNFSFFLRYSNSDTPERGATDLWFVDVYRKIFTFGVALRPFHEQKAKKSNPSQLLNRNGIDEPD